MKIVLFCENKYAIDILYPIQEEANQEGGHDVIWYIHQKRIPDFPLKDEVIWTNSIQEIPKVLSALPRNTVTLRW